MDSAPPIPKDIKRTVSPAVSPASGDDLVAETQEPTTPLEALGAAPPWVKWSLATGILIIVAQLVFFLVGAWSKSRTAIAEARVRRARADAEHAQFALEAAQKQAEIDLQKAHASTELIRLETLRKEAEAKSRIAEVEGKQRVADKKAESTIERRRQEAEFEAMKAELDKRAALIVGLEQAYSSAKQKAESLDTQIRTMIPDLDGAREDAARMDQELTEAKQALAAAESKAQAALDAEQQSKTMLGLAEREMQQLRHGTDMAQRSTSDLTADRDRLREKCQGLEARVADLQRQVESQQTIIATLQAAAARRS